MKISNLLDKEIDIVKHKKLFAIIPACVILLAIIAAIIYGFVLGEPLNLGMDFSGGYTVNVKLGTKLTNNTEADYRNQIIEIVETLSDDEGTVYGLKVANLQKQGSGESSSLYIKYKAIRGVDQITMEEVVNKKLATELQKKIFNIIPEVKVEGNKIQLNYNMAINDINFQIIKIQAGNVIEANNFPIDSASISQNGKIVSLEVKSEMTSELLESFKKEMTIVDTFSGRVEKGDLISPSVSTELLTNAILAISLAIVLMLVYIAFRFEVSSGLAAIVALLHDIAIMFCVMIIFHIEINSTFIAALITILGYSINNTIIIFDRIRESRKSDFSKHLSGATIANRSVQNTLLRSINTTLTTLFTIGMVALIGVADIRIFAIPIIVGLLSGTFSSICIAPTVWAMWKDRKKKTSKTVNTKLPEKASN